MANINLSGVLRDPLGEVSYGNTVKFTHETTTGETIGGFASALIVEINGAYDIDLEYGNVLIESYDKINSRWIKHGTFTINSETPATSLPELIGVTNPLTDPELLIVQNLVADAQTAKNEAEAAQQETEDLFNDFDSNVSLSVGSLEVKPTFEALLNDSLEISKGFGDFDTLDISQSQDGSLTVNLPTKKITYECPSVRNVINKSGVMEQVGENLPAISSDGMWFHEAYSNSVTQSSNLSSAKWSKINSSSTEDSIIEDSSEAQHYIQQVTTQGAGLVTLSLTVSALDVGSSRGVRLRLSDSTSFVGSFYFNLSSAETYGVTDGVEYDIETLNEGFRLNVTANYADLVACQIFIVEEGTTATSYLGDGISGLYVKEIQVNSGYKLPYVETESTAVSVAKTIASIPAMNNLPAAGQPFAIEVDCYMPSSTNESVVFRQARSTSTGLFLRRLASGLIQFGIAADGITKTADYSGDYSKHKYVCKYDGVGNIYLYEDGSQVATNTTNTPTYDLNVALNIGNDSLYNLNGQLKNFRIHHGDVSADTIKSWGGAK